MSSNSSGTTMNIDDLVASLDKAESIIANSGQHDCMTIEGLYLTLFGDGSGKVMGIWKKEKEGMSPEQHVLARIFSEESELFCFANIEELLQWLTQTIKQ